MGRIAAMFFVLLALAPAAHAQSEGVSLVCTDPPDENPATIQARAREHYDRGMDFYLKGEYDLAIREHSAAYCLAPSAAPSSMLAQSYQSLVQYEEAIGWYLVELRLLGPEDDQERVLVSNRVDRLRKLPARVKVSSQPPGAQVTLTSDAGTISGKADGEPLRAPAGTYVLRVDQPGHLAVEETVTLQIGQPYSYSYRLTEQRGTVRITTNPESARIFIDDRLVGTGGYAAELPVGTHQLIVEATGRLPVVRKLTVELDKVTPVFVSVPAEEKSGRRELLGAMVLAGLVAGIDIGGRIFTSETDEDDTTAGLFVLGTTAVAFGGGYFGIDEDTPVGHTSYIIGGTSWGGLEGWALVRMFTDSGDAQSTGAFAGAAIGALFTAVTASRFDPNGGDAALFNSGAIWGTTASLFLWGVFESEDHLAAPFVLGGVTAGMLGGTALALRYEYSRGHVALIDVAGVAGLVTGLAVANVIPDESGGSDVNDTQFHAALGGSLIGLVVGAFLTRNMDVEKAPATLGAWIPSVGVVSGRPGLQWAGEF